MRGPSCRVVQLPARTTTASSHGQLLHCFIAPTPPRDRLAIVRGATTLSTSRRTQLTSEDGGERGREHELTSLSTEFPCREVVAKVREESATEGHADDGERDLERGDGGGPTETLHEQMGLAVVESSASCGCQRTSGAGMLWSVDWQEGERES